MGKPVVSNDQIVALSKRQHELFRRLVEGSLPVAYTLERLQWLIEGKNLVEGPHVIDLDAPAPFQMPGFEAVEHRKGGKFVWDPDRIELFVSESQRRQEEMSICDHTEFVEVGVTGTELREEFKRLPVLNANVLSYLLERPKLIPERWKGKPVYFWGTIYRCSQGLAVQCLIWIEEEKEWARYGAGLDDVWHSHWTNAILLA